jgi:hypothetical protein
MSGVKAVINRTFVDPKIIALKSKRLSEPVSSTLAQSLTTLKEMG